MSEQQPHCGACVKSGREARCIYEAIRNKNLADQLEDRVNQLERMVERMEREGPNQASAQGSNPTTLAGFMPSGVTQPSNGGSLSGYMDYSGLGAGNGSMNVPLTLAPWHSAEGWSKLPDETHNFMVDTFMTYLPKSYLQIHPDRFLQALVLPENDPRSIHPAMISAIYLLACYHWSNSLSDYESAFLTQARASMSDSLSKTDRLFTGFIQPGILVAEYLINRGRHREAYHQIIQITRFSLDCNLHKITSPVWRPDMPTGPGRLLPEPSDAIELGERILAFWAVFVLDQRICLIMGLPSAFSKGDDLDTRSRIDTVWPESLYDYEEGTAINQEFMSLRFLCTNRPPFAIYESDYGFRMRLESLALYRFAGDEEISTGDVDIAISQFIRRLPEPDVTDTANLPSVVLAHVVARAATIRICARTSAIQTLDERALRAAIDCARMIHVITVSDYDMWSLDLVLSYIWADCAKIIARHIQQKNQMGAYEDSGRLRPALSAILAGLSKAVMVYPVVEPEVQTVEGLVAALN
ncbi:Fungal Zn(2)-Cys(6) binuclear cluster domain [Ceratobasidium sp. AG-Ba]|nr:Fungal Zn(2)-Cys(6) binuclear cluster domain [Ceratobasidium sp. AG-Ba]